MSSPARVWLALALLYAAFFAWYTPLSGPLQPEEIEAFVRALEADGRDPAAIARWRAFFESDTGGDFAMTNLIALREPPAPAPGVGPGESAEDVLGRYTRPFLGRAFLSGAHPVYLGRAAGEALDLWGVDDARHWSTGALVRYRSRRDLMEQVLHTLGSGDHVYKQAAIEKTIAVPLDPWLQLGDPRLLLLLLLGNVGLAWHLRCARRGA